MFPIGSKVKKFNDKINIKAQLQTTSFDDELNKFYHNTPLKKEPFEKSKTLSIRTAASAVKTSHHDIPKINVKSEKHKTKKILKS